MPEPESSAAPEKTPPADERGATVVVLGVLLLGALVGFAAYATSRERALADQVARHERREAALGYYLAGMDALRRRAGVATVGSLAVPAFERAIAADPGFVEAQFALGEAYALLGRAASATASYRAALQGQPENAAWLVRLADHLRTTPGAAGDGDGHQAHDYYRRAQETGEAGGAFTNIAATFLHTEAGELIKAVAAAETATRQAPHLWEAWAALGEARSAGAHLSGEQGLDRALLESALGAYDEANRLDPGNARCLRATALLLRQLGRRGEALEVLDELVASNPGDSTYLSNRGLLQLELGDLEAASRDLELALRLGPPSSQAYESRGRVRLARGDTDGALKDLDRAVELAPSSVTALGTRAEIHRARGNQDLAIADLTRAVEVAPESGAWLAARGAAYLQTKQYALAVADFEKTVELTPKTHQAWTNLGTALLASGDAAAAEATWTQGIARLPETSTAHLHLHRGRLRLDTQRAEEAIGDLELALSIGQGTSGEPLPPAAPLLLSRAYRARGRHDDAAALVLRALKTELPPVVRGAALRELGDTYAERGKALLSAGKPALAMAAFERALRSDPLPTHAYGGALCAVAAGDPDLALRWLERGFEVGLRDWRAIEKDERLGALLADSRLRALLVRMGAPAKKS